MAIKISGIIMTFSFAFAIANGKAAAVSEAALQGCGKATALVISLIGLMCLWNGIMKAAEKSGLLKLISRILSPVLRLCFPSAYKNGKGISEVSAAIVANVFGVGNAATPLAVSAMNALSDNANSDIANDDQVTFTVLGTAFPSLFPTTVISLRLSAGSKTPFDILPCVWICSLLLSVFAVMISRIIAKAVKQ